MSDKKNNTGLDNSGYYNSGNYNSGYYNRGNYNSGNYNSGYRNSGYYNSGDRNSGYRNSGDCNSGDYNSGNYNSGDYNSGWFNTNEPKMRFFNKDSDLTYSEFVKNNLIIYPDLHTCNWIYEKDMTEEEKINNPNYHTLDGYLKKMDYKEAWTEYWNRASESDKNFFLTLPNFNSEIFKEITGIDTQTKSLKGKKVSVELDGVKYEAIIQ